MQSLELQIAGLPHCPRNRSHIATVFKKGGRSVPSIIKTEAARAYETAVRHHLQKYSKEAALFRTSFSEETQYLVATWELHSPEVNTKSGRISKNGVDLDAHKVLQDTIMGFVGIDDCFIKRDTREKFEGTYLVKLKLEIRENNGENLL